MENIQPNQQQTTLQPYSGEIQLTKTTFGQTEEVSLNPRKEIKKIALAIGFSIAALAGLTGCDKPYVECSGVNPGTNLAESYHTKEGNCKPGYTEFPSEDN